MFIDTGNNVGIDTSTPQATLDVHGGIKVGNDTGTCDGNKR